MVKKEATIRERLPERVLAVVAHCDDIEAGSGGTIARWTAQGVIVRYLIVTDGGSGSNRPGENLAALVRTRREEQMCAATRLGVTSVDFLDYGDGVLESTMQLRRDITRVIRTYRPDTILTFDPEMVFSKHWNYINHPDHVAVGIATTYAAFPSTGTRPVFPELLEEGLEPYDPSRLYLQFSNSPDLVIDISKTIKKKADALRCHASQLSEETINRFIDHARDSADGHGFEYGEAFRVIDF